MNSPSQHNESLERIRSRAKELLLISGGPDTADAETLAAFVDGTLALDEISEATARRWIDMLGADALISDRLQAASEFLAPSEDTKPSPVLNEVIVPSETFSSVFGRSGNAGAPDEGTGPTVEVQPPPIPRHAYRPWWRRPIVGLTTATAVVAVAFMLSLSLTSRHIPGFRWSGPANQPLRPLQRPSDNLKAPAGEEVILVGHATGVQIYVCQAGANPPFTWVFKAPEADLSDSSGKRIIHHFAGPTWKHIDGSEVVGKLAAKQDAPKPGAIPWLLLTAASHTGQGVLTRVTSIQRIHTEGGAAPNANTCDALANGKESRSAYSADYYFYAPAH